MSNLTKALALFTFLFAFCLSSNAQVEKSKLNPGAMKAINKEKPVVVEPPVPADFPKLINTGNPEADMAKFYADRDIWYATHTKEEIEKLNGEDRLQIIKRSDFEKLPVEKRTVILNNPSKFSIIED